MTEAEIQTARAVQAERQRQWWQAMTLEERRAKRLQYAKSALKRAKQAEKAKKG